MSVRLSVCLFVCPCTSCPNSSISPLYIYLQLSLDLSNSLQLPLALSKLSLINLCQAFLQLDLSYLSLVYVRLYATVMVGFSPVYLQSISGSCLSLVFLQYLSLVSLSSPSIVSRKASRLQAILGLLKQQNTFLTVSVSRDLFYEIA